MTGSAGGWERQHAARIDGLNYLVYDSHRDAPVGFAVRVGKKDDDPIMELSAARRAVEAAKGSRA